jgi:hypothetical protein
VNLIETTSADPHTPSPHQRHRSSRRSLVKASLAAGFMASTALRSPVRAQEAATPVAGAETANPASSTVLFHDVRIFDGVSSTLSMPSSLLVSGNTINMISKEPIEPPSRATVIDGGGRALMPGLIDAHWHAMLAAIPLAALRVADLGYINLVAGKVATETLLGRFTSVRDVGGPVFGLKRAIDEGVIAGPRIYPSGAMLSQTSGHADFRFPYEVPSDPAAPLSHAEVIGVGVIADGPDAVLRATREQLLKGASQIKVMAGGGIASPYDPIDVTQYLALVCSIACAVPGADLEVVRRALVPLAQDASKDRCGWWLHRRPARARPTPPGPDRRSRVPRRPIAVGRR